MSINSLVVYLLGVMTGGGVVGYIMNKNHQKELDATYAQLSTIRDRVNGFEVEPISTNVDDTVVPYDTEEAMGMPKYHGEQQSNYQYPEEDTDKEEEDDQDEDSELEEDSSDDSIDVPLDSLDLEATKVMIAKGDEARLKEWELKKLIFNISDNDYYDTAKEYDKLHITYHPTTQTYLDEEEEPVENPEELIGSGLLFFGLHSGDKDIVYIRNKKLQSDIEVIRVKE